MGGHYSWDSLAKSIRRSAVVVSKVGRGLIPAKDCIIGLGSDRIAFVVPKTGIQKRVSSSGVELIF